MTVSMSPSSVLTLSGSPCLADDSEEKPPSVELDEKPPEETAMEKIDGVFGAMVNAMAKVFFYRIGRTEQEYIETNHLDYYVRDRGSEEPFKKLGHIDDDEPSELTDKDAEALAAQGKLVLSARKDNEKPYMRQGKIDDREVDYVTVNIDVGQKYIFDAEADTYRKLLPKRDLISQEADDAITPERAKVMAADGLLKTDKDKETDAYVLSRYVGGAPVVVVWLAAGAVFFTLYMRFVNLWGFRHAIAIVRGKYDNPDDDGEVSHFQALSSALSATVGLGNIAGVTIAMTVGGPGAFFWMMACGFFGMTSKFVECTMGQKFRKVKEDGTVLGGPMQYLSDGLAQKGFAPLGVLLALAFAIMCILASFGGGNMFQANQAGSAVETMLMQSDLNEMKELNAQIKTAAADKKYDDCAWLSEWPGPPIGDDEGELIATALGDKRSILLAHHGQLSAGGSVEEAAVLAFHFERAAQLQLLAMAAGEIEPLDPDCGRDAHDYRLKPAVVDATFLYQARLVLRTEADCLD